MKINNNTIQEYRLIYFTNQETPANNVDARVRRVRELEASGLLKPEDIRALGKASALVRNLQNAIQGDTDELDEKAKAIKMASNDLFTFSADMNRIAEFNGRLNQKYQKFLQELMAGQEMLRQHQNPLSIREKTLDDGTYALEQSFEVAAKNHDTLNIALAYEVQVPVFKNVPRRGRLGLRQWCERVQVGTATQTMRQTYTIPKNSFEQYDSIRIGSLGQIEMREKDGKILYTLKTRKDFSGTYTVSSEENSFQPFTLESKGNEQYRGGKEIRADEFTNIKKGLQENQRTQTDVEQQKAIEKNASAIAKEEKTRKQKDEEEARLRHENVELGLSASKEYTGAMVGKEASNRKKADKELETRFGEQITAEKGAREAAEKKTAERIGNLEKTDKDLEGKITAEKNTREAAEKTQQAGIEKNAKDLTAEKGAREGADQEQTAKLEQIQRQLQQSLEANAQLRKEIERMNTVLKKLQDAGEMGIHLSEFTPDNTKVQANIDELMKQRAPQLFMHALVNSQTRNGNTSPKRIANDADVLQALQELNNNLTSSHSETMKIAVAEKYNKDLDPAIYPRMVIKEGKLSFQ